MAVLKSVTGESIAGGVQFRDCCLLARQPIPLQRESRLWQRLRLMQFPSSFHPSSWKASCKWCRGQSPGPRRLVPCYHRHPQEHQAQPAYLHKRRRRPTPLCQFRSQTQAIARSSPLPRMGPFFVVAQHAAPVLRKCAGKVVRWPVDQGLGDWFGVSD